MDILKSSSMEALKRWSICQETSRCQKPRELWLSEGDRNTSFFHIMENFHRKKNQVNRICIWGEWVEGEEAVRVSIVNAYTSLLSNHCEWRVS